MWFYHVSFVVITCIFFALFFFLGLHVLYHFLMQLSSSLSFHLLSSPSFSFFFLFSSIFLLLLCFSFLTCFLSFLLFYFPSPTFLYFPPSYPLLSRLPLFSSPFLLCPLLHSFFFFFHLLPSSLFLFSLLLFIMFISFPLLRPVRYQKQRCSAWLPLKNHPWPNPALCHAGTSSKPASRGRLSSLFPSDTCSSACFPGPIAELDLHLGACLLPFDQTSQGKVCLFLGIQTLGVA